MAELTYNVEQTIGVIGNNGKQSMELRVVSWNGRPGKYDLRSWYKDSEGNERCNKGITFTENELRELYDILAEIPAFMY